MERLFEEVFVEVCAPTLRGIKPSNLFRYQPQNRDKFLEPGAGTVGASGAGA